VMVPMGVSLICISQSPTQASLLCAMEAEENKRETKKNRIALVFFITLNFFIVKIENIHKANVKMDNHR